MRTPRVDGRMRASRDALDGDDETQRVARFDEPTGPSIAVREIGGTEEFPLVPLAHETHRLAPGEDHLTRREGERFPASTRRIKLRRLVGERADVVTLAHGVHLDVSRT